MNLSAAIRTVALLALISAAPLPSMACGSPDLKTHVGKVLSVDKGAGTFALLDAESMSPVTFKADAAILDQVSSVIRGCSVSGTVAVTYETIGGTLRALELK